MAGLADAVDVPKCGGGDVSWDDRMLPGNGRLAWTPSQQDVDRQYANYVGCAPMDVSVAPVAECFGSLLNCSSNQSCPAVHYMICWDKLEAMSDDSYDSYEGVDGQPGYFDYDDLRDYDEWCIWNDVDEDEGYYAPFLPDVAGFFSLDRNCFEINTDPVVVASVGCATQPAGAHIPGVAGPVW